MPADNDFSECEQVADERPIRQGDIFQWLTISDDPWKQLGVLVTATCDIAQEKHRGILSYVPILRVTDYLRLFFLPKLLERGVRPLGDELQKKIHKYQAKNLPEFPEPLSEPAMLQWVDKSDPNEIADELRITDENVRAEFTELLVNYIIARRSLESENLQDQVDALARLRARQNKSNLPKAQEVVWREIQGGFETLPGDCFFIGWIGTHHSTGHVAYLRLVREIQHDQIAVKQSDLRDKSVAAQRIGQLRSPFIYRLTQQLVDVFASIGLPGEYEQNRRKLVESLAAGTRGATLS